MILQILGITEERIWELLAEKIGQERVDQIRGALDVLTGVWGFVRDVINEGPGAIWTYIQTQISNLWDMVLEQVKDWIVSKIIEKVTTKLLSMLDPTGVMAVINSFIAVYNAIESFIEYLREMLEIVNSFVKGIAEIARGVIQSAANFLEETLADAIPIVIGFLANQVGLGDISDKIREIIGRVQELVMAGLGWLIDKAMAAIQSIMSIFRGGGTEEGQEEAAADDGDDGDDADLTDDEVGERMTFRAAEKTHTLWISTTGGLVEVMVRSTTMSVADKLDEWEGRASELGDQESEALSLISTARSQYETTKSEGLEAYQEIQEAESDESAENVEEAIQADNEAESAEGTLKGTLVSLFELFEEENDVKERVENEPLNRI